MNLCGKYRLSEHQRFDKIWGRSDPSPHPDKEPRSNMESVLLRGFCHIFYRTSSAQKISVLNKISVNLNAFQAHITISLNF